MMLSGQVEAEAIGILFPSRGRKTKRTLRFTVKANASPLTSTQDPEFSPGPQENKRSY